MKEIIDRKSALASEIENIGHEVTEFVWGRGVRIKDMGLVIRTVSYDGSGDYKAKFSNKEEKHG